MKKKKNTWIYQIFLWTFLLSILFSYTTNIISIKSNMISTAIIIIIVIFVGIMFDMLGTAALTGNEATFHAKNAKKIKGAKLAIKFIKNNVRVSSICNDIIGDICGIVSGGLGAVLAIDIATHFNINITLVTIIIAAIISSLTVGGKAIFKSIAYKNADKILFSVSRSLSFFKRK
jgi:CBS domain containing-hemolysin-like protein